MLAEMCHGSPFHLQRTFKRIIGLTPIEYIQQFRVLKATKYLLHTNQSIKEISTAVGIENPEYFATLFKRKPDLLLLNIEKERNERGIR